MSKSVSKLEVFPEEFDHSYFHNQTMLNDRRLPCLRSYVHKRIKTFVTDRIAEYKTGEFPLNDTFEIIFDYDTKLSDGQTFNEYEWAIVRDELLDRGFDAKFVLEEKDGGIKIIQKMVVPLERELSLTETLEERIQRLQLEDEEDDEEDNSE